MALAGDGDETDIVHATRRQRAARRPVVRWQYRWAPCAAASKPLSFAVPARMLALPFSAQRPAVVLAPLMG